MNTLVQQRMVSQLNQRWQAINTPQHLSLQRPFQPSQTPSSLKSPGHVFGADQLQLNAPRPTRVAPVQLLQQQASASSLNRAIDQATGTRNTLNNRVTLHVDGKEAFSAMEDLIRDARQSLYMEMFLYHGDQTGWDMAQLLVEKKRQGVDVKVLLDALGQVTESGQVIQYLRQNGVDVRLYNRQLFDWENVNITHRKLLLADGYKGMTGGMNIGDEYAFKWHDLMVSVEGEAVQDMQQEFFVNWTKSGGQIPLNPPHLPQGVHFGNSAARITVTSPAEVGKEKDSKNAFISAIHSALYNIYVVQPYFSDEDIIQALTQAAQRGVKVKILLPEISDNPVHTVLNKRNAERMLAVGAEVFKVDAGKDKDVFTHGKLMTIDGVWTTIGSTNFDTRALENNQELNLSVTDVHFAKTVEERLFYRNAHALKPFDSSQFSTWERGKARFFAFFDRVF